MNCPLNSIGGDPPLWLYRMLKHCFLQRGISSTPTLNADWCQPLAYVCARPKVINKKEYHFSPKIGSNYAILVAVRIYCGYCVCVRSVYMVARCLS